MARELKRLRILMFVTLLIIVSYSIFEAVLLTNYGNKPYEELPKWVLFFLWWKESVIV